MAQHLIKHSVLADLFAEVDSIVEAWRESESPDLVKLYRGKPAKCISAEVFDALENLSQPGGELSEKFHAEARQIGLAITNFANEWVRFTDLARADADVNPAGDSQLWSTYETIRSATKKLSFKLPEPIDQLLNREKVPAPQVALIYGFLHADGTPDVNMVQAELEKPGTHFDPKTWVHPSQKSHDAEIARAWAKRSPANLPLSSYAAAEASAPEVAPEPLDMLIQQRVPVEQIATMKQIPVEEVEARARELGVILQDARNVYYPASKASAIVDQLAEDEAHKAAYDADQKAKAESRKVAVSKRVQELKAAGKSGAELKAAIDAEFPA
jgi:hypothetical protein